MTDNLDGTLTATVSYGLDGEFPEFVNTYTAPPAPPTPAGSDGASDTGTSGKGTPDTGDRISLVFPVLLTLGGAALVSISRVAIRRRK